MNEFENLEALRTAWTSGNFKYENEIYISGIVYKFFKGSEKDFISVIRDGQNPYVIYHTSADHRDEAKEKGLDQWVVMLWGSQDHLTLIPYDLRTITPARGGAVYEQVETIGDVALLKIMLPSGVIALKGKVDTGAEVSSLHVDDVPKIVGDMVKFFNRKASQNAIQAPLVTKQQVSSADGGTEYRPVIELDVEVNGKRVSKALFNLNDRSKMEYPVLIGQNILEKTGFLVNPNQNGIKPNQQQPNQQPQQEQPMQEDEDQDIEWLTEEELTDISEDDIMKCLEDVTPIIELNIKDSEEIAALYEALDSDITLGDLFRHVRTKAVERFEDVEY